jgi:RNA polymerase sigma-70 factor (ECF subfamily)
VDGVPANPPAWLLTAARRRAVDRLRAEAVAVRKEPLLVVDAEHEAAAARVMADVGDVVEDDLLRLVLLCAHPTLAPESASALSLRLVVGVPTRDVARLFLVPEPTMAARLTRARKRLATADFGIPSPADLPDRLAVVGQVAYLAFTTGYAPGSGRDLLRSDVAGEAVRLARVVHDLLPEQPLPTALLALMLLQHSRRDARVGPDGRLVLLPDQDRRRWRADEIAQALGLLAPLVDADLGGEARSYLLQALIAAEHATAVTAPDTDWTRIATLYGALETQTGSPVVRLNRAVAVAEASGPEAGLALLDGLDDQLPDGHRLPAVRGELLVRAGRPAEARAAFDRAVERCANEVERDHLSRRRQDALGR